METGPHGGARSGAGRKPTRDRKVKRSVALSAAADALILAQLQPGESYSAALERVIWASQARPLPTTGGPSARDQLVALLQPTRQAVAQLYRRLGWSRRTFEQVLQQERSALATLGVQFHVATKDAASGRREQYVTIDGMRYSAVSRADPPPATEPAPGYSG